MTKNNIMKNNIFTLLFIAALALFCSCESDVIPTRDSVHYDKSKSPVIISNNDLTNVEVAVGAKANWSVDFEAYNGIQSIVLNGEELFAFGNGQLTFSTTLSIVMPDADLHSVELTVVDELGLETNYPPFNLVAGGRLPSSYLICGLASGSAIPLKDGVGNDRRVVFPSYANVSNNIYSTNMGWVDATVETDLESKQVRVGVPMFNNAANKPKWPSLLFDFGAQSPSGDKALAFTHGGNSFRLTKLAFDEAIIEQLIEDVVDTKKRVFRMDIFVEPLAVGSTFDLDLHKQVVLGMSSIKKFNNTGSKAGQDDVMSANITKVGEWETITFQMDPTNSYIPTKGDLSNSEIDMLLLLISPKFKTETKIVSNATYYLRNLRIEEL